jgi:hypothetical protein
MMQGCSNKDSSAKFYLSLSIIRNMRSKVKALTVPPLGKKIILTLWRADILY